MMYRVMGGDLKLLRDIERNNLAWRSVQGGEVIQRALIEPIEYIEKDVSSRVKEKSVRDALALIVGGKIEQETPVGFIDVLSDTEVIEVKHYTLWKHGLGQVLSYQRHYPHLAKRLHLFAQIECKDTDKYLEKAKSTCDSFAVKVTFEEVVVKESQLDRNEDPEEPRSKRARVDNKWGQLEEGWGVDNRVTNEPERLSRAYRSEHYSSCAISTVSESEPFWWKHLSIGEKRAYASMKGKISIAQEELGILTAYKKELESMGNLDNLDRDEFADGIRDVKRRFTAAVDGP
ncbi:unnamed protein product, partial [Ectocarpus sp. 13 AM-2016]